MVVYTSMCHAFEGKARAYDMRNGFFVSSAGPRFVGALLLQDMANVVYIISGRRKSELEEWLGGIPRFVARRDTYSVVLSR